MPLPVIADVFRVAIEWDLDHAVNVLHVAAPTANEQDIFDAIDAYVQASTSTTTPFIPNVNIMGVDQVVITKLDGVSPGVVFPSPGWGGVLSGNPIPNQAAVVSMHTAQRGPRGRGRVYLGPVGESQVDNGTLGSTEVTNTTAAWEALQAALTGGSPSMAIVVASYVHTDYHVVTSFACRAKLGSQRRRLRNA